MMKKFSLLLLPFLLASCGGAYNAEKAYWQVSRQHRQVLANPAAASASDFDATVAGLKDVITRYPSW